MRKGIIFIALGLLAASCAQDHKYKIGVSQCSTDDWREDLNQELLREQLFHDDVILEIRSADDDNQKQIADLDYFVKNGFDAIVVSPNEASAVTPKIKEIYESGLPIVVFDRSTTEPCYTAFIGADNVCIGQNAAQYALSHFPKPLKIIEIKGLPGSTPAIDREKGFDAAIEQSADATLLGEGVGYWDYDNGYRAADSLLSAHPDANLIYAHNDRMAIGAANAAKKHGRDDIKVIGIDAVPKTGIQAVADSVIDATFVYPTYGEKIFNTALSIIKGEPYTETDISATPSAVDQANAELLLMVDQHLIEETQKVNNLKDQVNLYWHKHSAQSMLLYTSLAVLLLLCVLIYTLLRTYWAHKRHYEVLAEQKKQLEEQRSRLEMLYGQLQQATQSKLSFFTNVSHDLRTPLTLISEPVDYMTKADNLTPEQMSMMRLANKNVKTLMRLINQILDFRKAENGKLALNPAEIDVKAAIEDWAKAFEQVARKKHTKFSVEFADAPSYAMTVDAEKLERICFNLISNAFKYTPENGSVNVRGAIADGYFVLKVADTGRGINAADQKKIFDDFFRTDETNPGGSGIGLALTKTFVELHGGSIDVESAVGEGSVFTVKIPIRHEAGAQKAVEKLHTAEEVVAELADVENEDEVELSNDKPIALVIDDNADMRALVRGLICDKYSVMEASNGSQGIRLASKYVPDIIICDVMMPGIDGWETCRRLKAEVTTSHIPVLMLTACGFDEQRITGYESGADAYLSKPFNSNVLIARCHALMFNRRRLMESLQSGQPQGAQLAQPQKERASMQSAPKAATDIDDAFYNRFIETLEKNMGNSELSVEDMAAELGLSRVQFFRKIKALTNYSPVELIRNLRLKRAEKMLKSTQLSVSEICYTVGFSSPSYFTKCYKQYFGEAPTDTQQRTSRLS